MIKSYISLFEIIDDVFRVVLADVVGLPVTEEVFVVRFRGVFRLVFRFGLEVDFDPELIGQRLGLVPEHRFRFHVVVVKFR